MGERMEIDVRLVKGLVRRIEAQEKLLAAYRIHGQPSEATFTALNGTRNVVDEAKEAMDSRG